MSMAVGGRKGMGAALDGTSVAGQPR